MTAFPSKLPQFGTTIFSVMSKLALEHDAINLSQGFPDFEADPRLIDLVTAAMKAGHNQYAPMPGLPDLARQIALKLRKDYGWMPDPDREITLTSGGTEAIYSTIGAIVGQGDDVIVLEPCYDSYIPSILSFGGAVKAIALQPPAYAVNWDEVEAAVGPRTRAIMINTPQNPCGVLLRDADLQRLQSIVVRHGLYLISDEVYEHIIFDGEQHASALRYPDLYARTFVIFSFGKSLHVTGWKTGYVVAPPDLTAEFRKIHQFNVFSGNRPIQHAVSTYLERYADMSGLGPFYQQKRDYFLAMMKGMPLDFLPCAGSYFILADYSALSDEPDRDFAIRLTKEAGVATIPLSPFYSDGSNARILRFCFAKKEETLFAAAERLKAWAGIGSIA